MREGEVPGKGHLLSPGSRKSPQGGHAELATKEESALDSQGHEGERSWQRKLGVQKQEVGVCGRGQQ